MKIVVYGTGCANCQLLEKKTDEAIKELGVDVELVEIQDIDKMFEAGITGTPGFEIDGEIKSVGRVPSSEEIKKWIKAKI